MAGSAHTHLLRGTERGHEYEHEHTQNYRKPGRIPEILQDDKENSKETSSSHRALHVTMKVLKPWFDTIPPPFPQNVLLQAHYKPFKEIPWSLCADYITLA